MKTLDPAKTYLITGGAGFIGFHLSRRLLAQGARVAGFDNCNDYYDVKLKKERLSVLEAYPNYSFMRGDLANEGDVRRAFEEFRPQVVVNLGAQAGVRYSIENPKAYMDSNMTGFFHILEACRRFPVEHLVYASSSSVYGGNDKVPFSTEDKVDEPESLYAATKKANELMAHAYSKLYGIPVTGLRFFTVYGPYGRPDMAYFAFTKKILSGEPIQIYNQGDMYRDFTYIDDIVRCMEKMLCNPPEENGKGARYKLYNIGNNKPVKLMDFVAALERSLGVEAKKEFLPMQPGDVYQTYADVDELARDFGFRPDTPIEEGLSKFVTWYREYYG